MKVDHALRTVASVLFDAVYIPGGEKSAAALAEEPDAIEFVNEAFRHCKAIAASGTGVNFLKQETYIRKVEDDQAIVLSENMPAKLAKDLLPQLLGIAIGKRKLEKNSGLKVRILDSRERYLSSRLSKIRVF